MSGNGADLTMDVLGTSADSPPIPFELDVLKRGVNYQRWVVDAVSPFLGESILEVGAGIGNMSRWLPARKKLILSEADPQLLPHLKLEVAAKFGQRPNVRVAALDLSGDWSSPLMNENLDTVVSFNVLEHVEDDRHAYKTLWELLANSRAPGPKRLVTFVPAHSWLYGSMDKSYQHFRRYSHQELIALSREVAPGAKIYYRYFNAVGLPGWLAMGRLLKKREIGVKAVMNFERLCPWVRSADDFVHEKLRLSFGQSILMVLSR